MQGYLKFKETDEELYEMKFNFEQEKEKRKNFFIFIVLFLIHIYLKVVVQIKKYFHIITVKEIYSGVIFILPFSKMYEEEKSSRQTENSIKHKFFQKQLKKCIPKVKKLMKKYHISTLALSEELRKSESFLEQLQDNRIMQKEVHILDDNEIMPYLIKEILEYILQIQGKTTELEDLYLLIKQDRIEYKENIAFLSQYFKTINIVTPCLKNYQKLANQLEEKYNVMITVTNNKKKGLRKAKWLVNFDISSEEMKKYTIYRTATIIYLERESVYQESSFDGVHICKVGIDISEEIKGFFIKQHLLGQFSTTILYESTLLNKRGFKAIKEQMEEDDIKISKLYGRRGILNDKELKRVGYQ